MIDPETAAGQNNAADDCRQTAEDHVKEMPDHDPILLHQPIKNIGAIANVNVFEWAFGAVPK